MRLLLIGLALVSLVMSSAPPTAFGRFGILVGGAYAVMQIGRTSFMVVIAASADPGRIGRTAYHLIHPVMVAGIIVVAAADVVVLSAPGAMGVVATGWLILGGTALFIAGHAAFKFAVWRVVPWTRLAALVALGLLGLAVPALSALGIGLRPAVVVLAVAALDYRVYREK